MSRTLAPGRLAAGLLVVGGLGLSVLGGSSVTVASPAGAAALNHAAVVIDTGDGEVRKYCLAFPEPSISGAGALRRLDVDPVFSSYGAKGEAVCSLCGVGCPAGDCFCNAKFWSYHRAGPGGEAYATSRVGASSTEVRDGDVEGWSWGGGQAPPRATVGQVCDVPEPPARTAAASSSTTTEPQVTTTTAPPAEAPGGTASGAPPATAAPAPAPVSPTSPKPAPATTAPAEGAVAAPVDPAAVTPEAVPTIDVPADVDDGDASPSEELSSAAPAFNTRDRRDDGGGVGGGLSLAAFVAVLGGVLGWRARLRRSNVPR